jgi:hypothetical protein
VLDVAYHPEIYFQAALIFAASKNDELVALLIHGFGKYDNAGRGGSGSQSET